MSGNNVLEGSVQQTVQAASGNGQKLISQLLGLNEQQAAHGSHGGGQGPINQSSSKPSGWKSATQSLKMSDFFQGINVTPNFLFLMLFLGFTGWLGVVYFIRHHEPLANSVLGTGAAQSATTEADRRLVAGIKKTLPVHTSESTGDFYVPIPRPGGGLVASGDFGYPNVPVMTPPAGVYAQSSAVGPMPAPPLPEPPSPVPPQPTPLNYSPYITPQQQMYYSQQNAYIVPIHAPAGTRVKMIVNR